MSNKEETALVPRLRFPEFCITGEWEKEVFSKLYDFKATNSFSREKLNYKIGEVKNIHYGDIHTKFTELFDIGKELVPYINPEEIGNIREDSFCVEGDLIFADASEDLEGIGKSIELVKLNNEKIVSGLHTLLARPKTNKLIIGFGGHLFASNVLKKQIQREAQGAKVLGISSGRLSNAKVFFPKIKAEQQKIADCLSSLDELITAESEKLAVLKLHKKGLTQKLFPAEGKALPEWRFPEFRECGEWEEKNFGDLCEFTRGPFGGALKKEIFVRDGYAVYEQSHAIYENFDSFRYFIAEEKFNELNRFSLQEDDIIMSCSGTMGRFAIIPKGSKKGVINQALLKLTVKNGVDVKFVKMTLELDVNQKKLLSQSAGGAIKNVVSVAQMKEMKFFIPHFSEQQKIADCLSALDKLITSQIDKIESLKTHKKGLMQGLFPSIEEVGK